MKLPLLRLLQEITTWDKSCLPKAFMISRGILNRADENNVIRAETLGTLAHVVNQGTPYQLEAIRIASYHKEVRSAGVRKAAFQLLRAILKADAQYRTDATVLDSLNQFRKDKNVQIRKEIEELFSKYADS